jgi:hypothetical protein
VAVGVTNTTFLDVSPCNSVDGYPEVGSSRIIRNVWHPSEKLSDFHRKFSAFMNDPFPLRLAVL